MEREKRKSLKDEALEKVSGGACPLYDGIFYDDDTDFYDDDTDDTMDLRFKRPSCDNP